MGWQAAVWGLPLAPQSPSTSQGTLKSTSILTARPETQQVASPLTSLSARPVASGLAPLSRSPFNLEKKKPYRLVLCTPSPSVLLMLFDFLYFLML